MYTYLMEFFKLFSMLQHRVEKLLILLPSLSFSFQFLLLLKFLCGSGFSETLSLCSLVSFDVYGSF